MEELSVAYQGERLELQSDDMQTLVIKAMLRSCGLDSCDISDGSDTKKESVWRLSSEEITKSVKEVAKELELDVDLASLSPVSIGKTIGAMRFKKSREKGTGKRGWEVSFDDLRKWGLSLGLICDTPTATVSAVTTVTPVIDGDIPDLDDLSVNLGESEVCQP
jgi:hypothetical protein